MLAHASSSLTNRRTRAFTLVELLVVIILILVIASLVVAFAPRLAERQKVPRGADLLQGWLLAAKQRAKRDQIPTGLRLFPDANGQQVTTLQYVQKPDDYSSGQVSVAAGNLQLVQLQRGSGNFSGGFNDPTLYPVQKGDYIEFKGGGLVRRIESVTPTTLTLHSALPYPVQPTSDYRIIRQVRPLTGEASLDMPKDIIIDVQTNVTYKNPLPVNSAGQIDLIFAPSGTLLDAVGSDGFVALWVRDATADPVPPLPVEFSLEPIIITIYKATGLIAGHPVNPNPMNPYAFAKDGRSSGL